MGPAMTMTGRKTADAASGVDDSLDGDLDGLRHAAIAALASACAAADDRRQQMTRQFKSHHADSRPAWPAPVRTWPDRTRLTLLVYFLQAAGDVPLGYDFCFSRAGASADRVHADIDAAERLGGLRQRLELRGTRHVGVYGPGERAGHMIDGADGACIDLTARVADIIGRFGGRSRQQLDIGSTLLMTYRLWSEENRQFSIDDVLARVSADRPHVDPLSIHREAEFLAENNYLPDLSVEFIDEIDYNANAMEF